MLQNGVFQSFLRFAAIAVLLTENIPVILESLNIRFYMLSIKLNPAYSKCNTEFEGYNFQLIQVHGKSYRLNIN